MPKNNDERKHTTTTLLLWIILAGALGFIIGEIFMVVAKENYNHMIDHPEEYNPGMVPKDAKRWK